MPQPRLSRDQIWTYFMSRLSGQKIRNRAQQCVKCPFHNDGKASMSLNLDEGIWRCHGPCNVGGGLIDFELKLNGGGKKKAWAAIRAVIGTDSRSDSDASDTEPEAVYPYLDVNGKLLYEVVRFPRKQFRHRRPDGNGGYISGRGEIEPVLYNLPEVLAARTVFVTEGEKDAETLIAKLKLRELNATGKGPYAATTNTGGAGKWRPEYGKLLKSKDVVILQDNDPKGRDHARSVLQSASESAKRVRLIDLPGLAEKEDITDWFRTHSAKELIQVIKKTPLWRPDNSYGEESDETGSQPVSDRKPTSLMGLNVICLADVEAREVEWIWKPYIPTAMLTMLSGDPEAGKSFIALSICAQLTRGRLPDGSRCNASNVLYLTMENPQHEVLRPRFDHLGGEPKRFFLQKAIITTARGERDRSTSLSLELEKTIAALKPRLVIIDPMQSYIGAVDMNRSNETRPLLDELMRLAEKYRCAIVLIRHLTKHGGGRAILRGLGSIDFTGAVRSELLAGSLPGQPHTRAMVQIKSNVGPHGPSRGYIISDDGKFSWQPGPCSITAEQLLAAPFYHQPPRELDNAIQWLKGQLAEGACPMTELKGEAAEAEISWATVRRAKERLGVRPRKQGMDGGWMWSLPRPA